MANASPEIAQPNETQRAETAANRFYDMADKAKVEEAQYPQEERYKEEILSSVGRETAQGNFHGAQRLLEERSGMWNDNLRGAASEVNQLDQEKIGAKPMTFEEAQKSIGGYARGLEKLSKEPGGRPSDLEGAMDIDNIVADTSEPGVEGVDKELKYVEDLLQSKTNTADSILKSKGPLGERAQEFVKDWQEKRAIRDALYQEKQKRVEQGQQAQRATKEVTDARGATTSGLENMFNQAGVPEDLPSRQELLSQVGRMPAEEVRFFDVALKKAGAEFATTRDPALLQARLEGLSGKSWKREDVERRQKFEDQRKIEEIWRKMGLPEQQAAKPGGMSEKEIEKKKRLEDFLKREKGAAESQPPIKEAPRQERGRAEARAENPFEKLFGSKEITDALDNPKDTRGYTAEQGVAAMTEVFKGLYQNPKQFATRVETLLGKFRSAVEDSKRSKPTVSEEGHRNVANKEVIKGLSQSEKQAIDKFLDANYQKMGGKFHRMISTEWTFGDFISFLEGLKK